MKDALIGFAEADRPRLSAAHADYLKGLQHLSQREFEAGWELCEQRLQIFPPSYRSIFSPTPRSPADFYDRDVLVVGDPDYTPVINGMACRDLRVMGGYEVMFAQYYPKILEQRPKSLTVLCDARLYSLLQDSFQGINYSPCIMDAHSVVVQAFHVKPKPDLVVPLSSIGMAFIKNSADVPAASGPWLQADETATESWRIQLKYLADGRVPVALSPVGVGLPGKSVPAAEFLSAFASLADRFFFINLQYVQPGNDATNLTPEFRKIFGQKAYGKTKINIWEDFSTVAAVLTAIRDLGGAAVMIPSYTELIAGAVGVPVFKPLHGDTKPFHGFGRAWNEDLFLHSWVRTYLQEEPGEWAPVLQAIAKDLVRFADNTEHQPARHDVMRFHNGQGQSARPVAG